MENNDRAAIVARELAKRARFHIRNSLTGGSAYWDQQAALKSLQVAHRLVQQAKEELMSMEFTAEDAEDVPF